MERSDNERTEVNQESKPAPWTKCPSAFACVSTRWEQLDDKTKKRIDRLGWYFTRVVVVVVWCGVLWAKLGDLALPKSSSVATIATPTICVPLADYNQYAELLNLSVSTSNDNSNDLALRGGDVILASYVFECDSSDDVLAYCLVSVYFNDSCSNQLAFSVRVLTNGTSSSPDNVTIHNSTYDVYSAVDEVLNPPSPSPELMNLLNVPEGHFFGLAVLVVASALGGYLTNLVRLPPLLGMMIAGFLLRNVPIVNVAENISTTWSSTLRNSALVVILIRGGISLEAKKLWQLKFALPLLSALPCLIEGSVYGVLIIFILDFPWQWGLMLGYLLSSISPSVVVPTTLVLQEKVPGINTGVTNLIVAAANVDVVIAVSFFSIFLSLAYSEGSLILDIFRAPIELSVGLLYGLIFGFLLWLLPTKHQTPASTARNRFFLLLGFGLLSLFGGKRAILGGSGLSGAGPLGVIAVAFMAVQKWLPEDVTILKRLFYLLWQFAQPVLFGLIGAALDVKLITAGLLGRTIGILGVGLVVRLTVAVLAVTGHKFTWKEKVFVAISWLPKATVQAAFGSVALDLAVRAEDVQRGNTVLTVAIIAIVCTAPVAAILMGVLGPFLLKHSPSRDPEVGVAVEEVGGTGNGTTADTKSDNNLSNHVHVRHHGEDNSIEMQTVSM